MGEVIYCLTTTPPDLLSPYDDTDLHDVEHIDINNRMTSVKVERDEVKESEILMQYKIANEYYKECMAELSTKINK